MKKIFISLGIVLVIVGVIVAGVYGGAEGFGALVTEFNHDLSIANAVVYFTDEEQSAINKISAECDSCTVYLRGTSDDTISVKYVEPLAQNVTLTVGIENDVLIVRQKDGRKGVSFLGTDGANNFVVIDVPQSDDLYERLGVTVNVSAGGVNVDGLQVNSLVCSVSAGSVKFEKSSACNFKQSVDLSTNTGSITAENVKCPYFKASSAVGSVNVTFDEFIDKIELESKTGSIGCVADCNSLVIQTKTGSVNFTARAKNIDVSAKTGSINGKIDGAKSDYNIDADVGTGSCNIANQRVDNDCILRAETATGSIRISFAGQD